MKPYGVVVPAILMAILVLGACVPAQSQSSPAAPSQQGTQASSGPKILRIGVGREPTDFLGPLTSVRTAVYRIADAGLTTPNAAGEITPVLAAEVPSIEKGTWKINPDRTMEVTWKLRPNIKWQDGRPMTSDDLLFYMEYLLHPESALPRGLWTSLVTQITAPDPLTVVFSLKELHIEANVGHNRSNPLMRGMPRHILGEAFARGDVQAVTNSRHWREEFIGLGPYRLVRWEGGSQMEFVRFDDFVLGRPPLDRVLLAFFPDVNTQIANILAGELDTLWEGSLTANQSIELQRRWEGTGNRVLAGSNGHLRHMMAQARPDVEVKPAALRDRAVRQALFRAIDRQGLAEAINFGMAPIPDSYIPPQDPRRLTPAFRDAIPRYDSDPARAQRDLEALGWSMGPGGVLANRSGERFEFELQGTTDEPQETMATVVADAYKRIGVSVTLNLLSPQATDRSFPALSAGMLFGSNGYKTLQSNRFHSSQLATPANRYGGQNTSGYMNPQLDAHLDRIQSTLSAEERLRIEAETVRLVMTEVVTLPLVWEVLGTPMLARVRNIGPPTPDGAEGWNFWVWDVAP